jgi:hypothetical protein
MADLDNDGIPDVFDLDADGDGVANEVERQQGTDPFDPIDSGGRSVPTPPTPAPAPPPPAPPKRPMEITQVRDDAKVSDFLEKALAQIGDKYQRGVEASIKDADPDAFDGSELVEWAANRSGVMINDGAANQYRQMSAHGTTISVDDALHTPGAILYEFTGDPRNPTRASTAISLGDGRIIDIDPQAGVRIMPADQFTFTHAGTMPGFVDGANPDASAGAVVQDAYQRHGIDTDPAEQGDPGDPGIPDDGPSASPTAAGEADAVEARAKALRAELVEKVETNQRTHSTQQHQAEREVAAGTAALKAVEDQLAQEKRMLDFDRDLIRATEQSVRDAEARGDELGATEARERLDKAQANIRAEEAQVDELSAERNRLVDEVVAADDRLTAIKAAAAEADGRHWPAEKAIDALEEKARYLRESDTHTVNATRLRAEADQLRAAGNATEADRKVAQAVDETIAADAKRASAAEQVADESALRDMGLGAAGSPAQSPDPVDPTTDASPLGDDIAPAATGGGAEAPAAETPGPAEAPDPEPGAASFDQPAADAAAADPLTPSLESEAVDQVAEMTDFVFAGSDEPAAATDVEGFEDTTGLDDQPAP